MDCFALVQRSGGSFGRPSRTTSALGSPCRHLNVRPRTVAQDGTAVAVEDAHDGHTASTVIIIVIAVIAVAVAVTVVVVAVLVRAAAIIAGSRQVARLTAALSDLSDCAGDQ